MLEHAHVHTVTKIREMRRELNARAEALDALGPQLDALAPQPGRGQSWTPRAHRAMRAIGSRAG